MLIFSTLSGKVVYSDSALQEEGHVDGRYGALGLQGSL